ncbi:hypothetical protein GTW43_11710, partial [Streptomyces sp. SID5785]|uniref:zf-HC2 domain-containing protein n=1 Tax=Streptomyces sp. SID5785 TaxID=2690309 RepID=UPI001361ED7E
MGSQERHRDAGAYALGVLGAADRFRFEDHLDQCAVCAASVDELGSTARLLELYARATPPCVELFARPAPAFLDGVVDRLAAAHRAARRRLWRAGAVAVTALVLLGAGLGAAVTGGAGTSGGSGGSGGSAAVT